MAANRYRYVVVEGPIGVGKSSLARLLAEHTGADTLLEQPADNPFLASFYQDPRRWALATQLFFLFQRVNQLTGLKQLDLFERPTVADFLFEKDPLFAALNLADEELSIAEARKLRDAGVGEVLPNTISGPDLCRAVDALLCARRSHADNDHNGAIIAVAQARGGIGSTTVAVNLARGLVGRSSLFRKAQSRKVALIDLDLQFGNAAFQLGLRPSLTFFDLIEAGARLDGELLRATTTAHPSGLKVIAAPKSLMPLDAVSSEQLIEIVFKAVLPPA